MLATVSTKKRDREPTGLTPERAKSARDFLDQSTDLPPGVKKSVAEAINAAASAAEGGGAARLPATAGLNTNDSSSSNGGGGKGKGRNNNNNNRKQPKKLPAVNGKGSSEERLGVLESVIRMVMTLILKHDFALRQIEREVNRVLVFKDDNIICQCLRASKAEWDSQREVGKPHPSGRAFRAIAWELLWMLAARALASAAATLDPADQQHIADTIVVLAGALDEVQRFYPVQIEPRPAKNDEKKENAADDDMTDKNVEVRENNAQIWIVKLRDSEKGRKAMGCLEALNLDNTLQHLMDAELREDRGPAGSMARTLQDSLNKSGGS